MLIGCCGTSVSGDPDAPIGAVDVRPGETVLRRPGIALVVAGDASVVREGDVLCAFDGRLYSTTELQAALGVEAQSEAELLARAYARHGTEMLAHLRGAFSLAIWDSAGGRGLIAVDRAGTRAMFHAASGGTTVFATEVCDVLRALPTRPAPDDVAMALWLPARRHVAGRTLYAGIAPLGAACFMRLEEGGRSPTRYWQPRYVSPLTGSRTELAEMLRSEVQAAVRRRIDPGVTGAFLSGGLDSSTVAACAAAEMREDARLRCYSAVFPGEPDYDESHRIDMFAAAVPIESRRFRIAPQGPLKLSLEYLKRWQLPVIAPGMLIEDPLTREASQDGVRVLLDGQGGDESFGTSPYLIADRLVRGRVLSALRLTRQLPGAGADPTRETLRALFRHYGPKGALPYAMHALARRRGGPEKYAPDLLLPDARRLWMQGGDEWDWKRGGGGPRWWLHMRSMLLDSPAEEGRHEYFRHERASWGIDGRSPLYDSDLAEFALRVPPEIGFDPLLDRPLARDAMSALLPDKLRLQENKANFSAFYTQAVRRDLAAFGPLLRDPKAEVLAYVDRKRLDNWISWDPPPGWQTQGLWTMTMWGLVTAECWLRSQRDPAFADRLLESGTLVEPSYSTVAAGV